MFTPAIFVEQTAPQVPAVWVHLMLGADATFLVTARAGSDGTLRLLHESNFCCDGFRDFGQILNLAFGRLFRF